MPYLRLVTKFCQKDCFPRVVSGISEVVVVVGEADEPERK